MQDGKVVITYSRRNSVKAAIIAALALVLVVSPIHAKDQHAPLPASVIAAKTVYIDNQTGHAEITDRAYDALSKWGRFKILQNVKDADLVLRFTADTEGRPNAVATHARRDAKTTFFMIQDSSVTFPFISLSAAEAPETKLVSGPVRLVHPAFTARTAASHMTLIIGSIHSGGKLRKDLWPRMAD